MRKYDSALVWHTRHNVYQQWLTIDSNKENVSKTVFFLSSQLTKEPWWVLLGASIILSRYEKYLIKVMKTKEFVTIIIESLYSFNYDWICFSWLLFSDFLVASSTIHSNIVTDPSIFSSLWSRNLWFEYGADYFLGSVARLSSGAEMDKSSPRIFRCFMHFCCGF